MENPYPKNKEKIAYFYDHTMGMGRIRFSMGGDPISEISIFVDPIFPEEEFTGNKLEKYD